MQPLAYNQPTRHIGYPIIILPLTQCHHGYPILLLIRVFSYYIVTTIIRLDHYATSATANRDTSLQGDNKV